ncbi:hypothetical protein GJ700_29865 [Duganella sp. FT92W]|uniref:Uncharacterized protein n=1 Tax=Pseudoduganella rivuli TaxID=2666085 RepID=A0A7X2ITV9_9BURK|nr:hypothetical protein [Pseudoduganella rivuli]MRV75928.1 hypothetical protein [Pseudoduganella rivuli]
MSENVYFAAFFFPAAAAVVIFFWKYVAAVMEAKVRLAQDEAYRDIAAKAVAAQADTAQALATVGAALADIQSRVTSLEKILKEVE